MGMFDQIQQHISMLPFAVQLVGLMVVLAAFDFVLSVVAHATDGTFKWSLLGQWIMTKGLPILVVALLYGLDASLKLVSISVGDTDLGVFAGLAYAQGLSFVGQEVASILKNARMLGSEG